MFLFSGGCPSAYIKQSLFIHSTSGNGGKPVKKIPASATVLPTMKVEVQSPYNRISISHNRKGHKAFAVFLLSFLVGKCRRTIIGVKCRSPPFNLDFYVFKESDGLEEKRMAYNNGREDRKWRIWKEAEEKVLREHGVDEATIEQIRIDDRADFNSNRRFYHWTSDFGEYLEGMADREQSAEVKTVEDLLDEIEDENLYQALLTVDRRTLQIVLLKMKGYSTKEIAPLVHLTTGAIYARLDHLRKKLRKIL